jgi:hypothetical protein
MIKRLDRICDRADDAHRRIVLEKASRFFCDRFSPKNIIEMNSWTRKKTGEDV